MGKKIIRVFPRKTRATPEDENVRVGKLPDLLDEADEIHVSVAFTWDIPKAEYLAKQWECVAPVKIGGPAYNNPGGNFVPGMYLKNGYTITSRGCPNRCWFCSVPKREGYKLRELEIHDGWNILDDNILACSEGHIRNVFSMLGRQKEKPEFTGGLEAKQMKPWIASELRTLRPKQLFFAYDTPDDLEPLISAGSMLKEAGFPWRTKLGKYYICQILRCYVLMGYKGDTFDKALKRLEETVIAGFMPYAMLYKNKQGEGNREWMRFQREWARPAIIKTHFKE